MGRKIDFKAGQYIFINIPDLSYSDERGNRRHFTISNPPEIKDEVAILKLEEFTGY